MVLLLACAAPSPERFQIIGLQEDGDYRLEEVPLPGLEDPARMRGDLGEGWVGGRVTLDFSTLEVEYKPGRPMDVLFTVQRGAALPLDREGLILFSFWASLQAAREQMDAAGVDISPLFPLDFAEGPAVPDPGLALFPAENAAYVNGANTFVLLDDFAEREVPLAANQGVVAHELGHGVFHLLTTGDPYGPARVDATSPAANGVSALNEGFADMIAALVTGRSDFIEASLDMPERDLAGPQTAAELDLSAMEGEGFWDPYALGSVFAATAWDLHLGGLSREETLAAIAEALTLWAQGEEPTAFGWLDALVEVVGEEACGPVETRFAGVYEVAACSD